MNKNVIIPEKFHKCEIIEEYRCGEIKYGKFEFVIQRKSDGFFDICIYHKDFDGELQRCKFFKSYEEARLYIISEFINSELQ